MKKWWIILIVLVVYGAVSGSKDRPDTSVDRDIAEKAPQTTKAKTKKAKVNRKNDPMYVEDINSVLNNSEAIFAKFCGNGDLENCSSVAREEMQFGHTVNAVSLAMQICLRGRTQNDACQWFSILHAQSDPDYKKFQAPVFKKSCDGGNNQACNQLTLVSK